MNMKAIKVAAMSLIAAVATAFTASAADTGDIWRVDPETIQYDTENHAAAIGQTVKFSISLVQNEGSTVGYYTRPWRLVWRGVDGNVALAMQTMPPKIAIEVSGRTEYATYVSSEEVGVGIDGERAPNGILHKLYFEYTTKAGDFATPLKLKVLKNAAGEPTGYEWLNMGPNMWAIVDGADASTREAVFLSHNADITVGALAEAAGERNDNFD